MRAMIQEVKNTVYKDLGYANGWNETPPEIVRCRSRGHVLEGKTIGNCLHEHLCPICKYVYKVDSSG